MKVTINDIAKEAGVSKSLVSFYLNNPDTTRVAEKTRSGIDQAVKKLGYRRNEMAAQIRTGVSKTIAFFCDFSHTSSAGVAAGEIIRGLLTEAAKQDYGLKIYDTVDIDRGFDEVMRFGISNVICFSFSQKRQRQIGRLCGENKINLCYLQESCVDNFPLVYSDDRLVVRELVESFYHKGHTRMALLIPLDDVNFSIERRAGWLDGLESCGLTAESRFISSQHDPMSHYADIQRILSLPVDERPTVFICSDDGRAYQVQTIARSMGLHLPGDLEIAGFGNTQALHSFYPMTSVEQHFDKIGALAFQTVLLPMGKNNTKQHHLLQAEIVHYNGVSQS